MRDGLNNNYITTFRKIREEISEPFSHDIEIKNVTLDYLSNGKNEGYIGENVSLRIGLQNNGNTDDKTTLLFYINDILSESRELSIQKEEIIYSILYFTAGRYNDSLHLSVSIEQSEFNYSNNNWSYVFYIAEDFDNDGYLDFEELKNGLNVTNSDTNGDGVNDKDDYDPLDPNVQTRWDQYYNDLWFKMLFFGFITIATLLAILAGYVFVKNRVKLKYSNVELKSNIQAPKIDYDRYVPQRKEDDTKTYDSSILDEIHAEVQQAVHETEEPSLDRIQAKMDLELRKKDTSMLSFLN